jgi:hypothetical protein
MKLTSALLPHPLLSYSCLDLNIQQPTPTPKAITVYQYVPNVPYPPFLPTSLRFHRLLYSRLQRNSCPQPSLAASRTLPQRADHVHGRWSMLSQPLLHLALASFEDVGSKEGSAGGQLGVGEFVLYYGVECYCLSWEYWGKHNFTIVKRKDADGSDRLILSSSMRVWDIFHRSGSLDCRCYLMGLPSGGNGNSPRRRRKGRLCSMFERNFVACSPSHYLKSSPIRFPLVELQSIVGMLLPCLCCLLAVAVLTNRV